MHHSLHYLSSLKPFTRNSRPLMKTALSLFVVFMSCVMNNTMLASERKDLDSRDLLSKLDKLIEKRDYYYNLRKSQADSVKNLIDSTPDTKAKLPLYLDYGNIWSSLSADSAVNVLTRGAQLSDEAGDSCFKQRFLIDLSYAFFKRGQLIDCLVGLKNLENDGLCPENIQHYHYVSMIIYYTLGGFYSQADNGRTGDGDEYMARGRQHSDWLMSNLKPDHPNYHFAKSLSSFADMRLADMKASLRKAIELSHQNDKHLNEVSHTLLGEYYMRVGNIDEALRNYAGGAIRDIEYCSLDEVALLRLGELLYRLGDTARAYNYLAVAFENAVKGDMKFNLMRLNEAFMDVSEAQNREKHHRVSLLGALVVVLVILLLVVAKMIVSKRREVKHLRHVESSLARANLAKETYIAQFMNLCSSYIESLEDYNRMSKRKITAGQTEELLAYIKSGKIIEEQRHKFYDVFDDAFLHIFPNYIADVNKLLQPDKQIVTPSSNVLTTELRVLALSRLGIEDASIIARFLGISTNTIYTYRNKLRTRAIDRTTFEEEARKIGTI